MEATYSAYTTETIDNMWAYKSQIMKKIIDVNGTNCYDNDEQRFGPPAPRPFAFRCLRVR